jgi:uncharacterized membrane protein YphA (DoxX/SURF4 family)
LNGDAEAKPIYWRTSTRIIFRFVFCYLALYCLYVFSFVDQIFKSFIAYRSGETFFDVFWHHVGPWVGSHILHLATPITIFSNGSGDTTYDYALVFCEISLAAIATVIWSALDRNRPHYRRLHEWLRLVVRVLLAAVMLLYGLDKVVPVQFGSLTLTRLSLRVGDLTPFSFLWTFMAASKPYTIFCGSAEVLAGVLLVIPRMTTLGALIAMADMANVFALDMSYDVPVKLGSLHYLLMAVFLLAPEGQRFMDFFVLNRTAAPREPAPLSNRRWVNRTALLAPIVLALVWIYGLTAVVLKRYATENPPASARPALYGVWGVDEFSVSPRAAGPLFTKKLASEMNIRAGADRWTELIIDDGGNAGLRLSNGLLDWVTLKVDTNRKAVLIDDGDDPNWKCDFAYQRDLDGQLALQGQINGNAVSIKLHRTDMSKSLLVSRGFHWINEHPF